MFRKLFFISVILLAGSIISCSTDGPDNQNIPDFSQNDSDQTGILPDNVADQEENDQILPDDGQDDADSVLLKDSDGDGISDEIEKPNGVAVDTDEDGTPDYLDDDSDGDGIPDKVEGAVDTDEDGSYDYRDLDSDGDNIDDEIECPEQECVDTDKDGLADFLDPDSDGDSIPDVIETAEDSDNDGVSNYLDDDSDDDGISDLDEAGTVDIPRDSDEDGFPDYLDRDSDNDGLTDSKEKEIGTDQTKADTDGDGFDDNTELAAGSDPLVKDPEFYEDQFYVILPYQEPEKNDKLKFNTEIKKADIVFHFDLTGSMSNAIDTVKADIENIIIPGVKSVLDDPAFAIASYKHIDSTPHVMNQPVTTDTAKLTAALANMSAPGDGSIDSQYETLYQAASGHGFDGELLEFDVDDCLDHAISCIADVDSFYDVYRDINFAPQDCTGQMGTIGGGCFREAALPIQILMTDEALYDINKDLLSDTGGLVTAYRYKWNDSEPDEGHYRDEVAAAMNAVNAKFIGIMGTSLTSELLDTIQERMEEIANDTDSKTATGDFFIFQVGYSGGGLSDEMVTAIQDLLLNIKRDITTGQESVSNVHGIDTTQFIKKILTDSSIPANNYDSKDDDWFYNVRPNTQLLFDVTFENTIFEPTTTESTLFRAKITVYGEGALLDTRDVYIIVPGIKDDGGIKN